MAKQSLLALVQQACAEMGMPQPISVQDTNDPIAVQMLGLATREGKECSRRENGAGGWQGLRKEKTFNVQSTGMIPGCTFTKGSNIVTIGTPATQAPQVGWVICTSGGSNATGFPYPTTVTNVAGSLITLSNAATISSANTTMAFGQESYTLPSDYDYMISGTQWDRGYRWQVYGPLTPQEWQVLKSGLSPTGPRRRFRIMQGKFFLDPIPYDANLLVYEYYSTDFVIKGDGSTSALFSLDDDTYALADNTLVLGLIWRWRRAKGLDYAQEFKTYEDAVFRELGRDSASQSLQLDQAAPTTRLLTNSQIPDTGFGA